MAADVFMCSPRRPHSGARPVLLKAPAPDDDDDDSDTDEPSTLTAAPADSGPSGGPAGPRSGPAAAPAPGGPDEDEDDEAEDEEPGGRRRSRQQIIHSGHFMVSSPHREHPPKKGYDFDTVNKQTCQTYSFGKTSSCHLSIDASLTKLFECMTLAYSGKLVSPKWKNFKGLKLQWRDKIRLNNAIWRAWYMQYLEKRKNPVCHFVTPLDGSVEVDEHRRPEAITTEGKYWKRRIEIVIREYHKWRTYFKKRLQKHKDEDLSSLVRDDDLLFWHKSGDGWDTPVPMEEDPLLDTDMLMSEFSDTLFSTLSSHQPVAWPNPREIAHLGNADMIQPGLIPLQPNFDFMDTFEPFQDLFSSSRSIFGPTLAGPAPSTATDPSSPPAQGPVLSAGALPTVSLPDSLIVPAGPSSLSPTERRSCERGPRLGGYGPATDYESPEPPLSGAQTFLPVFPGSLLSPSPAPTPSSPEMPLVPPPAATLNAQAPSAFLQPQKFGAGKSSSVITHTASATFTHDASATTFSQSQGLVLTAQQPAPPGPPCSLTVPPAVGPTQSRLTFVYALKSMPLASGRAKQPPKIVPAPKPEPVSLLLKNAYITPAAFSGQPQAVIVTPGPLKREGVLTSTMSQPNVVITRAPGVPEFHSGVLVAADLGHATSSQPSPAPRLFSPSAVQDSLVKGEQISLHGSASQIASPSSSRDCPNSGQASPCASEQSPSPQSPQNCSGKSTTDPPNVAAFKSRRMKHISAEQKRRFNIKIGFGTLNSLISNNCKLTSHAITLQKTVEYIAKLQQERSQMQEEARRLREEIEELNATIISCQQQLPATGVPVTRRQCDHMRDMFDDYVKSRTLQNWKFWIFSIIIKPLFESFRGMVSTTNLHELHQSALSWLDQHCSLPVLRPMVLLALRQLSTTTSILTDPSQLPEQASEAVTRIGKRTGASQQP
ncbi:MLX-interacting protein [Antechinus flavipes]|uniref:MLX-interacting protein n=1 Tax=Antechinus flavipes TaxID=38775 RepID=UPI0022361495|nr:MLX-interacting protein [Antechinus flavipes]